MNKRRYTGDSITIGANEEVPITVNHADYFIVFSADQAFQLALDDEPFSDFAAGRSVNPDDLFEKVRIKNLSGSALTLEYAFGIGGVDDNALQVLGIVSVKNETGGTLQTNNPDLETLLKNDEDQRSPVSVKGGSSVAASNTAAVQTLVTPAANVNGLILRHVSMTTVSGQACTLFADTAAPSGYLDLTKDVVFHSRDSNQVNHYEPVFIPAGQGLYWAASAANTHNFIAADYDLL